MDTTRETMKAKIRIDRLYLGDNGRCFCGALRCAGMTAHYTGRDLSGQKIFPLTPAARAAAPDVVFRCEGCGTEGGQ
jgi:hypothetical protein